MRNAGEGELGGCGVGAVLLPSGGVRRFAWLALVALVDGELRAPARLRALLLAFTASALFWLHPSAVAFVIGAAAVLAVTSGLPGRRMARATMPLVPAIALLAVWGTLAHAAR